MQTDELERQLRGALRETLDRELGPHPAWTESPAARRVGELELRRRRWPLRVLAVAAVLGATGGAALLAGALNQSPVVPAQAHNGWIAFTVAEDDPAGGGTDIDILFTALGHEPRRVIGTDTDGVDQVCPAFSPDGRSLAFGQVEGVRSLGHSGVYQNSALVIADVADDGSVAERLSIDVGDGLPPPCSLWSPDGHELAFGVPRTSPINPGRSGEGSDVWVLRPADGKITVIPDLLATDLDWSPHGSVLAIAGGVAIDSGALADARIRLYDLSTSTLRTLDDTIGVTHVTWSPDGTRIAYDGRGAQPASPAAYDSRGGLRVIEVETGHQEALTNAYHAVHGVGPVWSPDGETIAYQRVVGCCEKHEVVLVTPGHRSARTGLATEVVMPIERTTADGSSVSLYPWRVTWSPDGAYLLYVAWTYPEGSTEQTVVVAVPTETSAPVVLLGDVDGIGAYDFSDDTMRVPIQIWGRR